ncbi:MAG: hypothetical protein QOF91_1700, partial [Alphaproteobacteria bacterium]|nr:hypothetical protein [Alphaproteobacteria bacterium]
MSSVSVLSEKFFHDEAKAFEHVEKILWPNGPICPKCGNCDPSRIHRLQGNATRL